MKSISIPVAPLICVTTALLAGIAAAIGVLARGDGSVVTVTSVRGVEFEMATTGVYAYNAERVVAEGIGWDVFTLVVAVPVLLVAAWALRGSSVRSRLFALGMLGYFAYQYLEYSVTWAFGPLFLLFVVIYGMSVLGIVWIGASVARTGVTGLFHESFPRRGWAALSLTMAALLTVMWLGRIGTALSGDLVAAGLTSETTLTIQALDLGFVVPALALSAVLTWRRSPAGYALSTVLTVTFVGMAMAIASMLLSAFVVEGSLEAVPVAIFLLAATAGVWIGARAFASTANDAPNSTLAVGQPGPMELRSVEGSAAR